MILVDTGPLFAVAARNDEHHEACTRLFRARRGELAVPTPVVPETCYMLRTRLGTAAEAAFLDLIAARRLDVVDLVLEDYRRIVDLVRQYASLDLGMVDAAIVALAERLKVHEIASVNPRDFTVVRPRHVSHFTLLP